MSQVDLARAPAANHRHLLIGLLLLVLAAGVLLAMGRPAICTCGVVKLWHGGVNSAENSQHIADWYTPSHITHGLLFYAMLAFAKARGWINWSFATRLLVAIAIEAGWEMLENSPMIIDRYRSATIAVGYTGDSVLNSLADIGWMVLGFFLAARMPVRASVALVLFFEVFTLLIIRDNLTLNVLMLIWPLESIRQWQAAL